MGGNHNKKVLDLAKEIWNYLQSKRIMGSNHNKKVLDLANEIWNYLQSKRIMLSTEYTPNQSNW